MLKLFTFFFYTVPLILSWLYFLIAILAFVMHIKQIREKTKISASRWMFAILNCGYILFFLITLIFFYDTWETVFSILGLTSITISACWSRYDEMRHGQRWWNW